jgi:Arc/MetJ-type ribon-helix-helix transcriptional regulator
VDSRHALTRICGILSGMMNGMTKRKIAVSLPAEQVAAAQAAVAAGEAPSVSAYVSAALALYSGKRGIEAYLEWAEALDGPVSQEAKDWVDAQLARIESKHKQAM